MRQFIHQYHTRPACQNCVDIHFVKFDAFVIYLPRRNNLQSLKQRLGFGSLVCFNDADYDVFTPVSQHVRFLKHRVGFPDTRGITEENL